MARVPAEEKPHYWIAVEGAEVWNRWGSGELTADEKATILSNIHFNCTAHTHIPSPKMTIDFSNTLFKESPNFSNFIFKSYLDFDGAKLNSSNRIKFNSAQFEAHVRFSNTVFSQEIDFSSSNFKSKSIFNKSEFRKSCYYQNCQFDSNSSFANAKFHDFAIFNDSVFNCSTSFSEANCYRIAFYGTTFNGIANFKKINFKFMPKIMGAYFATTLLVDNKEILSFHPQKEDIYDWAKLKYEMNKQHLHHEEIDCFAKELECRILDEDGWKKSLIKLYKVFSDYGRGILTPFGWLIVLIIFSTILYKFNFFYEIDGWKESLYLGIKGSIPLLPYDKHLELNGALLNEGFGTFKTMALMLTRAIHMTVAGILLFLIGLGIRNRLRIK